MFCGSQWAMHQGLEASEWGLLRHVECAVAVLWSHQWVTRASSGGWRRTSCV